MQGIWNVLKERSSVYARCVIGRNDEYSPDQNAEMYETQCETQNVSLIAHYVKTAIRQSANESSVTDYNKNEDAKWKKS
jgi:hypothetical protein